MALGRKAKRPSKEQFEALVAHVLTTSRRPVRDLVIVLFNFKEGMRAIEIGSIRWRMVLDARGEIGRVVALEDRASKGRSGRVIPMHPWLAEALAKLRPSVLDPDELIIHFQKGSRDRVTRSSAVQALFRAWYRALRIHGASSHSGRRTFGTKGAQEAPNVGASLRDVQQLLGHASLHTTQRYIDVDLEAQRQLVELV